ncbi:MAG TPA: ABC transporter substrate-binding protein [Fimbriimonas sp.]
MAFALSILATTVVAPAPPTLHVAAAFNLTGAMQSVDQPGYYGMKLAAEELNRGGRIKIMLHPVDGQSKVSTMSNALRNLLRKRKVDAIAGLYDSDYALAVGKIAQTRRIPFVSSGATLTGLTKTLGSYCFTACYSDDDQARAMAVFARDVLSIQTTSVLADPRWSYTRTIAKAFPRAFVEQGGRWLLTINDPEPGRAEPLRFGSESVYAATLPEDAGGTIKRLRQNGFEGPILSGDGWDTPALDQKAGFAGFKVFYTTHVAYDSPEPRVNAFVKAYTARFKRKPESASAALAYDTLRVIADAQMRRGSRSLRDAIASTRNHQGVTGKITYEKGSREPVKPVSVVEVLGTDRVFRGAIEKP